jgi:beta-lactamase regulating signal transducer with metallopeptidase domain
MTATQWLEVIASYSLQVAAVVAICRLLEHTLTKTSDRCAIWSHCFLCILLLGLAAVLLPRLHLIQPWSQLEPHILVTVSTTQTITGRLLLAVWCVGATVSLFMWVWRAHRVRQLLQRCDPMPDVEVRNLLGEASILIREQNLPEVLISNEIDGPFCWQLHRPTVVLPLFLLEGSSADLRHVLLHELEHLKTNHPFQLFWQHLVQVICWFHPAVWRAGSRASLMREFACDEAAAGYGANCAAYLRTLLRVAERRDGERSPSTIGFGRTPSEIVLRARRLVNIARDQKTNRSRFFGRKAATALLFAVACAMSLVWIPSDPLASPRSAWSPWPRWTARAAYCFGYALRDYEQYDPHSQFFEIWRAANNNSETSARHEQISAVH